MNKNLKAEDCGPTAGWLEADGKNIVLFHPHIPTGTDELVSRVLQSRWIGQGPLVDQFEVEFNEYVDGGTSLAVGSGTDALHLAYILAGVGPGDEVICPVFTCTATNLPLLYIGAKPVFADVNPETMNIDYNSVRSLITEKTKAIVTVDYGGLPCDYDELIEIAKQFDLKIIDDAAHAVGAEYKGRKLGGIADFTTYSFQAIKHITTGDGGMLVIKDQEYVDKARRIRWFGIDRKEKQNGIWANNIFEVGYKYQMTDIGAAMGLSGLHSFHETLKHRQTLLKTYESNLRSLEYVYNVGIDAQEDKSHAAWLHTILVDNREELQRNLRSHGIEAGQVHFRNDMYSIFGNRRNYLKNMDEIENKYLVLPLHTKMTEDDAFRITEIIRQGW